MTKTDPPFSTAVTTGASSGESAPESTQPEALGGAATRLTRAATNGAAGAFARRKWRYRGLDRPSFADRCRPGQTSVWDFPRPPQMRPERRQAIVQWGATQLATSDKALVVAETAGAPTVYFPTRDVRTNLLVRVSDTSVCEWKGVATSYALNGSLHDEESPSAGSEADQSARISAWSYDDPRDGYEILVGHIAFHPRAPLICMLGGIVVSAQAGGLYGGWVTPDLAGPIKGADRTSWW
jgi:uncharacterized protein (DUF427 family)